jgi:hypothetical protein
MVIPHIFKDINKAVNFIVNKEQQVLDRRHDMISPHREGHHFTPFDVYFNDAPRDKFVMTRLKSGRFSLKPNLSNNAFLYRGQNRYFNPSKPSMFRKDQKRFLKESVEYQEMYLTIASHPMVQLLDSGLLMQGENYSFEMNLFGLTQHYYNKTSLMDLTSSIDVASFFAVTDYDNKHDTYSLYTKKDVGVLYFYELTPDSFTSDGLRTIGLQVFPRSERQRGFLKEMEKEDNFNNDPHVSIVRFYHNPAIEKIFFRKFHEGHDLFPNDILTQHWKSRNQDRISKSTFLYNMSINPQEDPTENTRALKDMGVDIVDYSPAFTSTELHDYYQDIKNGWWQSFCDKIYIPRDKNGLMKEDMLSAERNPDYAWAFREDVDKPSEYPKGILLRDVENEINNGFRLLRSLPTYQDWCSEPVG